MCEVDLQPFLILGLLVELLVSGQFLLLDSGRDTILQVG